MIFVDDILPRTSTIITMVCPAASHDLLIELSICAAVFSVGCYGPNPDYLGVAELAGDSSSESSESGVSSGGSESSTDSETTAAETGTDSESGTETGTDTDDPEPSCANGIAEAGEFCFSFVELLALPEVQSLATADFDGDQLLDLAIGRKDDLLLLFGDGSGKFPFQANLPEPNSNYFGVGGGDLDGDQIADLVVAQDSNDAIVVHRSLAGKAFAEPTVHPTSDQPQRLAVVDLDGDDLLDVVVATKDKIDVLLGDGNAGFGQPMSFSTGGDQPRELSLALFDDDPSLDLIVGNVNGKSIALLLGDGSGQLATATVHPLTGKPRSTAIADFDRDGRLDVAVALEDRDSVQLLLGDGLGGLVAGIETPVGKRPMAALANDFDRDGAIDLLVVNQDDATVSLLFGVLAQPGEFSSPQLLAWFTGFAGMSTIASADLDGDGVDDVLIGGSAGLRAMISNP